VFSPRKGKAEEEEDRSIHEVFVLHYAFRARVNKANAFVTFPPPFL